MLYRRITATNRGYSAPNGSTRSSIAGLNNKDAQAFTHMGIDTPDLSGVDVLFRAEIGGAEDDKIMLIAYDGTLATGVDVPVEDVVGMLKLDFGWPDDATLVDGVPTIPSLDI